MNDILDLQGAMLEELHPDLVPYLEDGVLGKQLRHPLVYQVPLWTNGYANKFYEQKLEDIKKAIANKKWSSYIFLHERPYRIGAFCEIADQLNDKEYWSLLGEVWTDTENAWQNLEQWEILLGSQRGNREYLMNEDEQLALASLADIVTVYRGCDKGVNEDGISWTLKKERAQWFATRFNKNGIVVEKTISKSEILAVFNGRNEYEVIL